MGKKRVIVKTEQEAISDKEKVDKILSKEVKVKTVRRVEEGNLFISSTFNNTLVTLTDLQGNALAWASAGNIGFKGTKKSTPFAASKVAETISQKAQKIGVNKINVFIKGVGSGRESALRSLASHGMEINSIKDVTPISHGGCRPPKARRV